MASEMRRRRWLDRPGESGIVRRVLLGLITAVLVLIPGAGAVASTVRQDTEQGAALYAELGCPACHGSRGQGFIGPALSGITLSFEDALDKLRVPTGGMPEFDEDMISDEAFFDVYAYLRELGGLDVPEPPELTRQ